MNTNPLETSMSLLPDEFVEQRADARFFEAGEFFNLVGFCSPVEFETPAQTAAAPRVSANWLFSSEAP